MLYSTKRKWDKLITHAGAPVPPPTSSSAASPPPSSSSSLLPPGPSTPGRLNHTLSDLDLKKRRLADAGLDIPSTPASHASIRAVSPSAGSAFLSGTTTTVHSVFPTRPSPSYAPWDRDAFLARLATFRFVDKWPAKPSVANEVAWAKRGWICVDKNRVRCGACRREVYVGIEADDESTEEGKALVDRVAGQVVTEHEESCLWRRKGCDETIHRLPLTNPATAIPAFNARYITLSNKAAELPEAISHPTNLEPSGLHYPTDLPHPISESAAVLALFGWEAAEPGIPSLITCSACFRRLGLWLFRRTTGSSTDENGDPSMMRLDPLAEHRDYCPWVNSESQSTPRGLAGWEMLAKILERPVKVSGGGAASVRSVATSVGTIGTIGTDGDGLTEGEELSPEERDKRDESRMKKLRRLKGKYFGKSKKKSDKEKEGASRPGTAKSGYSEATRSETGSVPPTPTTPKTPRTPKR